MDRDILRPGWTCFSVPKDLDISEEIPRVVSHNPEL